MFAYIKRLLRGRAKPLRRFNRELLAITYWIHSLFLLHLHFFQKWTLPIAAPRYAYNASLVVFILFYSYVSDMGWWSVIWDLLFIYAYPFVLAKRMLWIAMTRSWSFFKKNAVLPKTALIGPTADPQAQVPVVAPVVPSKATVNDSKETGVAFLCRPLYRFTLLWSLLVLTVYYKPFLWFITVVCLFGAGRSLYSLQDILSDTSSWTGTIRGSFAKQISDQIGVIREWREGSDSAKAVTTANTLRLLEVTFAFIDKNKVMLSRFTWIAALIITLPFYLYISFLFTAAYFALSKIQNLPWDISSAFVDSLYIPFAFTELPKSWLLRGVAGLQAVAVTVIGWNVFVRHLSGKFEGLVQAANEFRTPLLDEELIAKLRALESQTAREKAAKAAEAAVQAKADETPPSASAAQPPS